MEANLGLAQPMNDFTVCTGRPPWPCTTNQRNRGVTLNHIPATPRGYSKQRLDMGQTRFAHIDLAKLIFQTDIAGLAHQTNDCSLLNLDIGQRETTNFSPIHAFNETHQIRAGIWGLRRRLGICVALQHRPSGE